MLRFIEMKANLKWLGSEWVGTLGIVWENKGMDHAKHRCRRCPCHMYVMSRCFHFLYYHNKSVCGVFSVASHTEHKGTNFSPTITLFPACFSPPPLLSVIISLTMLWTLQALDSGSAGYTVTAGGNSLCFILLAVNGSWDDNGCAKALIIFLCLQERYCFFSQFIGWVGEGCACVCVCVCVCVTE